MSDKPVEEWNRNFNQEPFAKVFATPHGQLLAYMDYENEDDQYSIVTIGQPVRGVVPRAILGYDTEEDRQRNYDKIDQVGADNIAQSLFAAADQLAPAEEPSS